MLSSHCSCRNKSYQSQSLTTPPPPPSLPPPPPPPPPPSSNRQRTMEEVWEDINLASLNDHNTLLTSTNNPNFGNTVLQDFLARPFTRESQTPSLVSSSPIHCPVPSQPATVLSLGSGPEFHCHFNSLTPRNSQFLPSLSNGSFNGASFESLACDSSSLPSFANNKRSAESDSSPEDRRHKRMIKNRESAARSRARKQANFFFF